MGAHRQQVGNGKQEGVDGFAFSLIINCLTVSQQVFNHCFCQGLFRLETQCLEDTVYCTLTMVAVFCVVFICRQSLYSINIFIL